MKLKKVFLRFEICIHPDGSSSREGFFTLSFRCKEGEFVERKDIPGLPDEAVILNGLKDISEGGLVTEICVPLSPEKKSPIASAAPVGEDSPGQSSWEAVRTWLLGR